MEKRWEEKAAGRRVRVNGYTVYVRVGRKDIKGERSHRWVEAIIQEIKVEARAEEGNGSGRSGEERGVIRGRNVCMASGGGAVKGDEEGDKT